MRQLMCNLTSFLRRLLANRQGEKGEQADDLQGEPSVVGIPDRPVGEHPEADLTWEGVTSFVEGTGAFHIAGRTTAGMLVGIAGSMTEVTQGCWEEGFPFPDVLVLAVAFVAVAAFVHKDSYFD